MKIRNLSRCLLPALLLAGLSLSAAERPRLAILTDIGGDPDDQQSMVRLMVYANQIDVEILMATAVRKKHAKEGPTTRPDLIREIVAAYGKVLPNLRRHESGWPSAEQLLARTFSGNPHYGREFVGEGQDTAGSRALLACMDAGAPARPLNICLWGGQTDLAQALWRVKHDRGAAGLAEIAGKTRIFDVADQDGLADWIRAEFPGLFYILEKVRPGEPRLQAVHSGMYLTGDLSLTSRAWVDEHVLSRGALGALYPVKANTMENPNNCMKEGDTFSFFFFLPVGGNDPSDPTKPGWGGQYVRDPDGWYRNPNVSDSFDPRSTVSRWRPAFQADFARRMAWCAPAQP